MKDGRDMAYALDLGPVLFGCVVALVAAFLAVKWLIGYLARHGLGAFAWYRFALAIAVYLVLVRGA
jgi:undecaprenyl-diphosphatase